MPLELAHVSFNATGEPVGALIVTPPSGASGGQLVSRLLQRGRTARA